MRFRVTAASVALAFSMLGVLASSAHASVECGDVVTANVRLNHDLSCVGEGLVVGADGVAINLGGHTLEGVGDGAGIDNTAGHDGVGVRNGSISGFDVGVALTNADRNVLADLSLRRKRQSGIGINLDNSDANRVVRVSVGGGDPALRLTDSDFNRIRTSEFRGGVSMRQGDAVELGSGSDRNRILDSNIRGVAGGFLITDSDHNVVRGSTALTYGGNGVYRAERTVIDRNSLSSMGVFASRTTIRYNVLLGGNSNGLSLAGDRNRVIGNNIRSGLDSGITVGAGWANLIKDNLVEAGFDDRIVVNAGAQRSRVLGNTVSGGGEDGIDVEAPGTILGWNRAENNQDLGIEAVDGVIDWGGNRASGNGNPLQCVGVRCS